jgi:hypothetical protein
MNPSENQNQHAPSPQTSTPESVQSFAPQAIFSHPPLSSEQLQAQQEEKVLKKKKLIKKMSIITPMSILAIGVLAALLLSGIIPLQKLKTVTYDNEVGNQFKLKFYSKHTVKNFSAPLLPSNLGTPKQLTSVKSINGSYPLGMIIVKLKAIPSPGLINCTQTDSYQEVDRVKNAFTDGSIILCSSSISGAKSPSFYQAIFKYSDSYYAVIFVPDLDYSKLTPTSENAKTAKESLQKINLLPYQDDISTILASIKPL